MVIINNKRSVTNRLFFKKQYWFFANFIDRRKSNFGLLFELKIMEILYLNFLKNLS